MNHAHNLTTLKVDPPLVIHVLTSLDFGGVERHMEFLASGTEHARMKHMYVALQHGGAAEAKLHALGADVLCLGQKTSMPSIGAFLALSRLYRKMKPIVVHTHGAEANFYGLIVAAMVGVPVRIGEEIGIPSHSRKAKLIFRLIYSLTHRVIGISKNVTDWLIVSREVQPENAICLYNPVELPMARDSNKYDPVGVFRICFVGRLELVKNPLALVHAAHQLFAMGVPIEVWLIGDGSLRERIEREVLKLGLSDLVKLLGFQSDPFQFVRQCSLYCQPSLSEGFGIAMVEAMGCGLPVVVTSVGGAPEIVSHGNTGWLLADNSLKTLVDALHAAWSLGAEKLVDMGQSARYSVEGRFEPVTYIKKLEQLYAQIAEERGVEIG